MPRVLVLPITGLLLLGLAGAALAQSSSTDQATGAGDTVPAAASASPDAGSSTKTVRHPVLDEVLADLVEAGTITQAQADAITSALDARRTELREQAQANRELWRSILEDGQITREELEQLPADSPLRNLESLLDDDVITLDELRGLGVGRGPGLGHGRGFGRGFERGFGFGPWAPAPTASPNAGS